MEHEEPESDNEDVNIDDHEKKTKKVVRSQAIRKKNSFFRLHFVLVLNTRFYLNLSFQIL